MAIIRRSYQNESDQALMLNLARQFPESNLHITDLPYRLNSWAFDEPENIALWFDEQRLVAWAALQSPFWAIDYACAPSVESSLGREILNWAETRARKLIGSPYERPSWFVSVFAKQTERIRDLENAGFKSQADQGDNSWSKVFMRYSMQTPVTRNEPPAGFAVRPLAGENEVEKYVELHQSVFNSKNMTVDWRMRTLKHPAYKPSLDLIVEAPDGRLAAFCVCWFDEILRNGQVEPMGCHADFRGQSLARAALTEGIHRLQTIGAENIFVETDNYRDAAFQLYKTCGFRTIKDVLVYGKNFPSEK